MKILKIIDLGYVSGGAEAGVVELKEKLQQNGHVVKILSSNIRKYNDSDRFSDFEFRVANSTNPFKFFYNIFNPYSYFTLRKILKDFDPDIIHLHTMEHVSPSVLFLLKKYPTVMTVNGPETFLKPLALWTLLPSHFKKQDFNKKSLTFMGKLHYFYHVYVQRFIYKLGFKNVDLFISISNFITEKTKNEINPIITLNNFVRLLNYKVIKNNNLLFLGRIEKVKGVEYLILGLPDIINKFPDTKLTVVGDGGYLEEMIKLTKRLNMQNSVIFTKKVNHDEIEKYYHNACIVILPSIWPEAFGKVGVEAMSAGRPVIATNVGGIPEWLNDGRTGYLIDKENSDQITNAVIKLLSNRKLLKDMGNNARLQAEKYNVDKYVKELEKIYKSVILKYEK